MNLVMQMSDSISHLFNSRILFPTVRSGRCVSMRMHDDRLDVNTFKLAQRLSPKVTMIIINSRADEPWRQGSKVNKSDAAGCGYKLLNIIQSMLRTFFHVCVLFICS